MKAGDRGSAFVIKSGSSDLRSIAIREGALVTVFNPKNLKGQAFAVPSPLAVASLLTLVQHEFDLQDSSSLVIKILGTTNLLTEISRALTKASLKIEKSVSLPAGEINALFYPATGRLRLEKASLKKKVRVLVVDDSATIQKLLKSILESDPDCEVVGSVTLPSQADAAVKSLKPDVITMDIHMPEMNGVELLRILHPKYGIPTVMITSVSREESDIVLEALDAGAVDYIQKPSLSEIDQAAPLIIEKVKIAARAKTVSRRPLKSSRSNTTPSGPMDMHRIVAIGSSTGGTEALREIFIRLPAEIPPIVVVQHIPAIFSEALARRLNDLCPFEVKEAADGDELLPGRVLIAPGGRHMKVARSKNGTFRAVVYDGETVNRFRPSVDVLFDSVASEIGAKALGIILTGMGADGAKGLLKMRERGSHTIAQDEATSVVFGMPREAIRLGGAQEIAPLDLIAAKMMSALAIKKRNAG